jgi:hypothetical protein
VRKGVLARLVAEDAEEDRAAGTALTRQQIQTVIEECADIATQLRDADPADLATAYSKLGLRLTYHPGRNLVQATATPGAANIGKWFVSEGDLNTQSRAFSPILRLNTQLGEKSPVRGFHALMLAGTPEPVSSGLAVCGLRAEGAGAIPGVTARACTVSWGLPVGYGS